MNKAMQKMIKTHFLINLKPIEKIETIIFLKIFICLPLLSHVFTYLLNPIDFILNTRNIVTYPTTSSIKTCFTI